MPIRNITIRKFVVIFLLVVQCSTVFDLIGFGLFLLMGDAEDRSLFISPHSLKLGKIQELALVSIKR